MRKSYFNNQTLIQLEKNSLINSFYSGIYYIEEIDIIFNKNFYCFDCY